MTRKTQHTIPAQSVFDEWHKNPEYVREFKELEEEYKLADQLIKESTVSEPKQRELTDVNRMEGRKVFTFYSHQDAWALELLHEHLSLLLRENRIQGWFDRYILADDEPDTQIAKHLKESSIFLLLVSADFLASDPCYKRELAHALRRHYADDARVIPIIVAPCDWKSSPLGRLKAMPHDGNPITEWPNQDSAFLDIVTEILHIIEIDEARTLETVQSKQEKPSNESGSRQDPL